MESMEALLIVILIAAFTGLVSSVIVMYNLLSSKKEKSTL